MKALGIRVDTSASIGIGHLFRCLRLANNLRKYFDTITFITFQPSDFYKTKVQEYGFQIKLIENKDDLKFLKGAKYNVLIKDHYNLDKKWEEEGRSITSKFIVMDDRPDQSHCCDIYINQNPIIITPSNLSDDCMILNGLRYTILPNALLDLQNIPMGNDILISLGGSDPTNELQKCLVSFKDMDEYNFHFIAGKENPDAQEIESVCKNTSHYIYHHFIDNIHELAARSLACITAGGTFLRELIFMQTPCFLITNHDVQIPIAEFFKSQNALYYAGHHTDTDADNIKISFTKFIKDENALRKYKQNMASLIDGKGLARIANAITSPPITLISATANHCQRVYDWRNHPTTRHYSGNNQEINIQDHNKWFERKLNDPDTYIFIASKHNEEIGVLRFDPAENGFVVSLYLAPDHHGYGYGASILLKAVKTLKEKGLTPLTLLAKISPDNKASQNAFKKAGFVQTASDDWKKSLS